MAMNIYEGMHKDNYTKKKLTDWKTHSNFICLKNFKFFEPYFLEADGKAYKFYPLVSKAIRQVAI